MNHFLRLAWRAALLGTALLPLVAGVTPALAGSAVGAAPASVQAPTLAPTAHPTGGQVTAGQGAIQQQGGTTTITQLATPVGATPELAGERPSTRVWVQLTKGF